MGSGFVCCWNDPQHPSNLDMLFGTLPEPSRAATMTGLAAVGWGNLSMLRLGAVQMALGAATILMAAGCSAIPDPFASPVADAHVQARANPLNPEEPLHCAPIWNLTPEAATQVLQVKGWQVTYRFEVSTGPDTGFAQAASSPPAGVVTNVEYGDPHWLIMFVSPVGDRAAKPLARPADCP